MIRSSKSRYTIISENEYGIWYRKQYKENILITKEWKNVPENGSYAGTSITIMPDSLFDLVSKPTKPCTFEWKLINLTEDEV